MTVAGPGRFITLEGGEGVGKSTLSRALAAALRSRGREVVLTREPGGSPGADEIRALLVRGDKARWSPIAETLLFAAARSDHLDRVIRPALARGAWVICDRYRDSTMAYQAGGHGLPRAAIDALHDMIDAPTPDLTLVLDIDPALGLSRSRGAEAGEARFETMGAAFHARVRRAFLDIAAAEPRRCAVIDTEAAPERVLAAALEALEQRQI
jgi:dTMP kinase